MSLPLFNVIGKTVFKTHNGCQLNEETSFRAHYYGREMWFASFKMSIYFAMTLPTFWMTQRLNILGTSIRWQRAKYNIEEIYHVLVVHQLVCKQACLTVQRKQRNYAQMRTKFVNKNQTVNQTLLHNTHQQVKFRDSLEICRANKFKL